MVGFGARVICHGAGELLRMMLWRTGGDDRVGDFDALKRQRRLITVSSRGLPEIASLFLTSSSIFSVFSSSSVAGSSRTGTHKSYKSSGTILAAKRYQMW